MPELSLGSPPFDFDESKNEKFHFHDFFKVGSLFIFMAFLYYNEIEAAGRSI
jgi:hypothetical protein